MAENNTWTGERLETSIFNELTLEHLHRYALAAQFVRGKKVLDIASGEGYGSNLLANHASLAIGVDISSEAIGLAKGKYKRDNLEFRVGSADKIPCEDDLFDVVVSFETLEHHDRHDEMMKEVRRVMKKDGILIISTPDKLYYSDKTNYKNKYHVKELYKNEFKDLIGRYFRNSAFFYQKAFFGSLFLPEHKSTLFQEYTGNYNSIEVTDELGALYIICIASDSVLPETGVSIFKDEEVINNTVQEAIRNVKRSNSFRLGNFLLSPVKLVKKVLNA